MVMIEKPAVFVEMIKYYCQGKLHSISQLTDIVAETGIISTIDNKMFLRHESKEMLINIALGMIPNTLWTVDYEVTRGLVIVKDEGDAVC